MGSVLRSPLVQAPRAYLALRNPCCGKSPWAWRSLCHSLTMDLEHVTPFWASVSTLFPKPSCPLQLVSGEGLLPPRKKNKPPRLVPVLPVLKLAKETSGPAETCQPAQQSLPALFPSPARPLPPSGLGDGGAADRPGPAGLPGFLDLRVCTHLLFSKYVSLAD